MIFHKNASRLNLPLLASCGLAVAGREMFLPPQRSPINFFEVTYVTDVTSAPVKDSGVFLSRNNDVTDVTKKGALLRQLRGEKRST